MSHNAVISAITMFRHCDVKTYLFAETKFLSALMQRARSFIEVYILFSSLGWILKLQWQLLTSSASELGCKRLRFNGSPAYQYILTVYPTEVALILLAAHSTCRA